MPTGTITELATLIAAIGALIVAIMNARSASDARAKAVIAATAAETAAVRAEEGKREVVIVHGEVVEVGKRIDGRLTQLLLLTEKAAHAAGVLEGKGQQESTVAEGKIQE